MVWIVVVAFVMGFAVVTVACLWIALSGLRRESQVSPWTARVLAELHEEQRLAALRRLRPHHTGLDDRPRATFRQPAAKGFDRNRPRDPWLGRDVLGPEDRKWTQMN